MTRARLPSETAVDRTDPLDRPPEIASALAGAELALPYLLESDEFAAVRARSRPRGVAPRARLAADAAAAGGGAVAVARAAGRRAGWRWWSTTTRPPTRWPSRRRRTCREPRSPTCRRAAPPTAAASSRPPHLVGERGAGAGRAGRGRPGGGLGRRAGGAGPRRSTGGRRPVELDARQPSRASTRSSSCWPRPGTTRVDTVEERGELLRAGRARRRLPDHRPRADAGRVLRRRDRAPVRLLGVHPALAARARPGRRLPRRPSPATWSRPGAPRRTSRSIPAGLVALRPSWSGVAPGAGRGTPSRWRRPLRERSEEAGRAAARRRSCGRAATCGRTRSRRWSSARARSRSCRWASRSRSRRSRRRWPRSGSPRPRTSCARWCGPATGCWSCFPHLGEAERTRLALNRIEVETAAARRGRAGRGRGRRSAVGAAAPRRGRVPWLRLAVLPVGAAVPPPLDPPARSGWAARWPPSATCGRATTSSTTTTASAGSSASTPRRWAASCATTCTSSSAATTASTCPHEQLGKVSRYIGSDGSRAGAVEAGRQGLAERCKARARIAVRELAGELLALYARRQAPGAAAVPRRRRVDGAAGGGVPLRGDRRPAARDRRGHRGHGGRAADGPAGLRRRRLRQDRGGGAGGDEGASRAAARCWCWCPPRCSRQQHGATFRDRFRDFPVRGRDGLAVPAAGRGEGGAGATSGRARSTS